MRWSAISWFEQPSASRCKTRRSCAVNGSAIFKAEADEGEAFVREAAKADVLSTGASFLALDTDVSASGEGGYARQLNEQEGKRQQDALNAAVAKYDVVITTAQVPGRRPSASTSLGRML